MTELVNFFIILVMPKLMAITVVLPYTDGRINFSHVMLEPLTATVVSIYTDGIEFHTYNA